jgi:small nuclear ribonucleoprotein G
MLTCLSPLLILEIFISCVHQTCLLVPTAVSLNGNRTLEGVLRGYDQFMNVVLDECVESAADGTTRKLGMSVVRGNSILSLEVLQDGGAS